VRRFLRLIARCILALWLFWGTIVHKKYHKAQINRAKQQSAVSRY